MCIRDRYLIALRFLHFPIYSSYFCCELKSLLFACEYSHNTHLITTRGFMRLLVFSIKIACRHEWEHVFRNFVHVAAGGLSKWVISQFWLHDFYFNYQRAVPFCFLCLLVVVLHAVNFLNYMNVRHLHCYRTCLLYTSRCV